MGNKKIIIWLAQRRVDGHVNIRVCAISSRMEQVNICAICDPAGIVECIEDLSSSADDAMKKWDVK